MLAGLKWNGRRLEICQRIVRSGNTVSRQIATWSLVAAAVALGDTLFWRIWSTNTLHVYYGAAFGEVSVAKSWSDRALPWPRGTRG